MSARPLRYLLVSGLSLATHNAVMIGADGLGAGLIEAVLASFAIVVLLGYALHARYTFRTGWSGRGLARYAAAMSLNIPLAWALTGFWHVLVQLPMAFASPLATVMMIGVNYLGSRWATGEAALPDHRRETA